MAISDVWDFFTEKLGDAWDDLLELPSTIWEIFGGLFENFWEFSPAGIAFGVLSFLVIYVFRGKVFQAFQYFPVGQKVFWEAVIFIGSFAAGYLIGKRVFDLD